jgi:hypothetical protein
MRKSGVSKLHPELGGSKSFEVSLLREMNQIGNLWLPDVFGYLLSYLKR